MSNKSMAKQILRKLALIYGPLLAIILYIVGRVYWYNFRPGLETGIIIALYMFLAPIGILAVAAYHKWHAETKMARAYFLIFLVMEVVGVWVAITF